MRGRGLCCAGMPVVLACLGLLVCAAAASAGQFTVVTCQGDNVRYSADAFSKVATPDMRIVNACNPGPAPRGLITRNKVRGGKHVAYGAYAAVVLHPPAGTVFTHLRWSGHGQRKECRFALQMWAEGASMQPSIETIANRIARSSCPPPPRNQPRRAQDADLDAVDWPLKDFDFPGGATQIVQRTICLSRRGCSVGRANYIRTEVANLTVQDEAPPSGVDRAGHSVGARRVGARRPAASLRTQATTSGCKRAQRVIAGVLNANDERRACPAAVAAVRTTS